MNVANLMDWGMLGYFIGAAVGEQIPVVTGRFERPELGRGEPELEFGYARSLSLPGRRRSLLVPSPADDRELDHERA